MPFLFKKRVQDPGLGAVRAWAEDIGAALKALSSLRILCTLFSKFQKVSGLKLKPKKCVIVLTSIEYSEEDCTAVRN